MKDSVHILLVEDDDDHAELVRRAIEPCGQEFQLAVVRSLAEARTAIAESEPDMLVVDFVLPDGRGIDLLPPEGDVIEWPVLLVTSCGNEEVAVEAMKRGAVDYAVKSIATMEELPYRLRSVQRQWTQITMRRKAEEDLANREALYRTILEAAPQIIWLADAGGAVRYVNGAWEKVTGVPAREALGSGWTKVVHPDDAPSLLTQCELAYSNGESYRGEYRFLCRDGRYQTFDFVGLPVRDQTGQVTSWVGIKTDITERKLVEETLRETATRFRTISDALPVSMAISLDGQRVFGNRASEQLTGYSQDELLNQQSGELAHPEYRESLRKSIDQCCRSGKPARQELKIIRKDGQHRWVDFSVAKIDHDGEAATLGASIDITERKEAEDALRESEQNYRLLIENAPSCIHQLDLQGRFTSMNQAGLCMIGASNDDEIKGVHYLDLVADSDRERIGQLMAAALSGVQSEFEFKAVNDHFFASSFIPIRGANGDIIRLMGISNDITDRKKSEEKIRDSQALYQSLVEHVPQFIFRKDLDGRFTYASPGFCRKLGANGSDVLGKTDFDLYPLSLAYKYRDDDRRIIESGETLETTEEYRAQNGVTLHVHVVKSPVYSSTRQVIGVQGIFWDVTKQKRIEQLLNRNERLAAMGTLAAGVAHEINNPVAAARFSAEAALEVVGRGGSGELVDACLKRIIGSMNRCGYITNSILGFARQDHNALVKCDVNAVVRDAASLVEAFAYQHGATIKMVLDEEPGTVDANPLELELALGNIVRNSIQSSEQAVIVRISTKRKLGRVQIAVVDNGAGMSEEQQRRMCDPFYSTRHSIGGTGLGMSIVFGIVKDHRGELDVQSSPEEGTEITIDLPQSE